MFKDLQKIVVESHESLEDARDTIRNNEKKLMKVPKICRDLSLSPILEQRAQEINEICPALLKNLDDLLDILEKLDLEGEL